MRIRRRGWLSLTLKGILATALAVLALSPLAFAADRAGTVTPDLPFAWEGPSAVGHNEGYDGQAAAAVR